MANVKVTAEDRLRGYWRRGLVGTVAVALMAASVFLPHIAVEAALGLTGRSLLPVSTFFVSANPNAEGFAGATSVAAVGFAISITYLGLALQQIGLLIGIGTFWVLIAEDVGRWLRRFVLVSGVCLILSASTVVLGYQLFASAGVPALPGIAWLPTLAAGVVMFVGGRFARRRLVSTWYWDKAEVVQP